MGYGIDLLVISPNDSEALRLVIADVYREIPVVVLDRAVSGEDYTLFIGPDNDQIGYLAGLQVVKMLGEKGGRVVEILGTEDSPPVSARANGFARAIADCPNIIVEEELIANWLQDQAQDRFKEYAITCRQMADVVVAQSDAMAYGAWIAANELRIGGARFVGMDGLEGEGGGVDLVNRGILEATFYCPTGGREAVEYVLRILSGEEFADKHVILEPHVILKEEKMNLQEFKWTREPAAYCIEDGRISITTQPHTDLWQRTYYHFRNDNAPVFQLESDERYFSFVLKAEFQDSHQRYDQCGVVMYLDSENWLKASVEYENEEFQNLGSVVTNHGYSDWATTQVPLSVKSIWFRLSRREDDYCIEHSADGVHFHQMRVCHMHEGGGKIHFGVYACSPEESSFTAVFTHLQMTECAWKAHDGQQPDQC